MSTDHADRLVRSVLGGLLASGRPTPFCSGDTCRDPLCPAHNERAIRDILAMSPEVSIISGNDSDLARMIDHTLLKAEATSDDIERLCAEAAEHGFASVCINPVFVPIAVSILRSSPVRVCTVVGFPLGATTTNSKRRDAEESLAEGAQELDMVIAVGHLKSGALPEVRADIETIAAASHAHAGLCKVILETALLTDEEKIRASMIAQQAGADYVKTSTGFSTGGATPDDVALLRRVVGRSMGVKAAGGIRTRADALTMVAHGASRIGTSSGVSIVQPREAGQPAGS
jgi:deoxyribose-phosphate aldolase